MLPNIQCSQTNYICINAFYYRSIIVYFTVLKPGTLYLSLVLPLILQKKLRKCFLSCVTVCEQTCAILQL